MRYVLMFLLFSTTSYAIQSTSPKVIFQISCERAAMKILAGEIPFLADQESHRFYSASCDARADDNHPKHPARGGCALATTLLAYNFPSLPNADALFIKYCNGITE